MSARGTVVFSASEGYDANIWDDSALMREYNRALESSRELMRSRKAQSSRKKGRDWKIGDSCRAVYREDGLEYEGSVVFCNKANRSVTVRFFGYNNEEDVKERDLMESLGKEEIEAQMEQARLDMEEEEEEEGAGDEHRRGDWCRARWSEDEMVYEATVESVDRKKGTAKVTFVGFGNSEVKRLEELYMSKGEERRREQDELSNVREEPSREDQVVLSNIREEELQNLLIKNCPDLLANFGDSPDLGFESLSVDDEPEKKKKEKKEKGKGKEKKKKEPAVVKTEPVPNLATFSAYSTLNQSPSYPPPFPAFPPAPQLPGLASPFSPFPQLQPPPSLPPPPALPAELANTVGPELHSLLLSWYMAGYHTGLYQGVCQDNTKRRSKKK